MDGWTDGWVNGQTYTHEHMQNQAYTHEKNGKNFLKKVHQKPGDRVGALMHVCNTSTQEPEMGELRV